MSPAVSLPPEVDTPCLVVDVGVMEANLLAMAHRSRDHGWALRPHAKTHKCIEIARRQIELGAVGLTVATAAEAEVFAAGGIADLFIAYPVWAAGRRAGRLRALAEQVVLCVGLDSADGAEMLGRALAGTDATVMVEIDCGHHRTGVPPREAGAVAVAAARAGLPVGGVFTIPGHGYGPDQRDGAAADESRALAAAADALRRTGIEAVGRSGGSTPTAALADDTILTEVRPGVYVFNDAQQVELGAAAWSGVALSAVGTVVSRADGRAVLDAGSKTLGADQPSWTSGGGRLLDHDGARITALSEHHATVTFPPDGHVPELGSQVRIVPNHVCAAVNLADRLLVARDGVVVDEWPVAARGHNT